MMWAFAVLTCLLLLVVFQLGSIRYHLARFTPRGYLAASDASLSLEAWMAELEERGSEILAQMARERAAVDAAVARLEDHLASSAAAPLLSQRVRVATIDSGIPAAKNRPEHSFHPPSEGVQVGHWKRNGGSVDLSWTATRQRVGQDWDQMQYKALEMAGRGMAPASIARALGLGQGEVRLLLRVGNTFTGEIAGDG